jgi:peroxiredoxin Q/BCP
MEVLVSMPDSSLLTLSFSDLLAQTPYTVLYFYPKDNTSGCSLEAQDFNNFLPEFARF